MDPPRSASPFFIVGQRTKTLSVTKWQVERQLAAVVELRQYNAAYLEDNEKAWIASIIENALLVREDMDTINEIGPERASQSGSRLFNPSFRNNFRKTTTTKGDAAVDIELRNLLTVAQSLNAAMHLLSCCYARWHWMQSSKASQLARASSDSKSFLNWTRHSNGSADSSILVGHHRVDNSTKSVLRHCEDRQLCTENPESDGQLSLVLDTVGKWRQDAEEALIAATQGNSNVALTTPMRVHMKRLTKPCAGQGDATIGKSISTSRPRVSKAGTRIDEEDGWCNSMFPTVAVSSSFAEESSRSATNMSLSDNSISTHATSVTSESFAAPHESSSSVCILNLKNSFGMESIPNLDSDTQLPSRARSGHTEPAQQSFSRPSTPSSRLFSNSTNASVTSLKTNATQTDPVRRSRGRMWLQQQSEASD